MTRRQPNRRRKDSCPDCGKPKRLESVRCQACASLFSRGRSTAQAGVYSEDGVHVVGRRESIITYRHLESGCLETRHCIGPNVPEQVADGLRHLPPGEWEVECRSTPASILRDLTGRDVGPHPTKRRFHNTRVPE